MDMSGAPAAGASGAAHGGAGGKDAADTSLRGGAGRQTTTLDHGVPSRRGWLANCLSCVCFRWGGGGKGLQRAAARTSGCSGVGPSRD